MRYPTRLVLMLGCVLTLGIGLAQLGMGFLTQVGLDPALWNEWAMVMEREEKRRQGLDRLDQVLLHRIEGKQMVTTQLVEGKLTLFEAAQWFAYFNETPPDVPDDSDRFFSGETREERLCRQVIQWVQSEVNAGGWSEGNEMVANLEADLAYHLCLNNGKVKWPVCQTGPR